jgi:putative membrane protein insertion efficiency factor
VSKKPGISARALMMFLRIYQAMLSPIMPLSCKYYPTCSHYAYGAVERFGARRGSWLALRRLLRCNPFMRGGFDPVPDLPAGQSASTHHEELAR